jgi:sensor histidine kinase YesM
MLTDRKLIFAEVRDVVLLGAAGLIMTWLGLTCKDCIESTRDFWVIGSFTALTWIVLWKGNEYLGSFATRKVSWLKDPGRKFAYLFIFTIVYTLGAMYTLGTIYSFSFGADLTRGAIYSVIITIIISLFMHGKSFLRNWKESSIAGEKLERESIAARYESLKNQVNPHFLFNSFNALSNLVYEDPDKAVKFIKQLSEVYRFVLDTREKEVVPLSEELHFMDAYLYLQQIRFGSKLNITVSIHDKNFAVAPLALQMLIENAIKHNVVSDADPLTISVSQDDGYIVVKNNLQKKTALGEQSARVGLENIRLRYEFLSAKPVIIAEDAQCFTVKLPLLNPSSE